MIKNLKLILLLAITMFNSVSGYASSFVGSRSDFRDETIYFVMTTRFYDGDTSNNTYCWDGINEKDPEWRGDFKGLIDKLDYIKHSDSLQFGLHQLLRMPLYTTIMAIMQ